ncbi:MAG: alpha-hydroxy-acid oxidizing protein [Paracoccaceae bacterium]|nr:alpha-hydroxy-acid oxidizing protein [Paracoccaceae bacterium]
MTRDLETEFLTLHEFVAAAHARLDANGWDYLIGAAETETTAARNRRALDSIALRPRVLIDVSDVDTAHTFLGRAQRLPILLAPVGGLETFDPEGAVAAARAAGDFGVPAMVSSVSQRTKAEVRAASDHQAFFQLYVRGGGRFIEEHVEQAIEAGLDGFCLTVDTAHYSRRERDIVKRFQKPWRRGIDLDAYEYQKGLTWDDVARIRKAYDIPLILKGVATAEDARIAADHGVEVVYVSNHGGRQLDHGRGAMEVLPEVVEAVGGKVTIVVDGGFYRGTDIVKAIAMGADAVGLGRLYCYGLAAAGPPGVVRLLEILEHEVQTAMGLLGVARLADLDAIYLHHGAPQVTAPTVLSAFPLLDI